MAAIAAIAVVALVVVPACPATPIPPGRATGDQSAAANSRYMPEAKGLKVTHYVGGLPYVYGVSGEVDGTYVGHTILSSRTRAISEPFARSDSLLRFQHVMS